MFCTTLRRRASFAPVISKLVGQQNLGLRESQLVTHDIAIPIVSTVDSRTGSTVATRQLRVLLLSSSATSDEKLSETVERIRRFAALTGGQDLAIVFLLDSAPAASVASSKAPKSISANTSGEEGVLSYSKLQATMIDHTEIPHVPILPLAKFDGLPALLRKHVTSVGRPKQVVKPTTTPFTLLQLCTANPPMSQQTAYILSDLFSDLRELAAACTSVSSAPNSSSPSARAAESSTQMNGTQPSGAGCSTQQFNDRAVHNLKQLRDLVGEQECVDIVDFFKEEWVME